MTKTKAILIWTVIVILIVVGVGLILTRDWVYTGTNLKFDVGGNYYRRLIIDANSDVTVNGGDCGFFLLRKLSGEIIIGKIKEPPFDSGCSSEYYASDPAVVRSGEWIVQDGSPTIGLTSNREITAMAVVPSKGAIWIGIGVIALMVWVYVLIPIWDFYKR